MVTLVIAGGDVPSGLNGGKAQASTNNRSCCEFARLHCSLFQVLGCQADREAFHGQYSEERQIDRMPHTNISVE